MASASTVLRLVFSSGVALLLGGILLILGFQDPGTEDTVVPVSSTREPEQNDVSVQPVPEAITLLPDFVRITDIQERKARFLAFLGPVVRQENTRIMAQRQRLMHLWQLYRLQARVAPEDDHWLSGICREYRVDAVSGTSAHFWMDLLARVDVVPVSLALAQAANESGWGTSRFAREGNNLFGQWYFAREGGMVPLDRGEDQNHKLAQFETVNGAVRSYLRNLNTGGPYADFRRLRAECHRLGRQPDALSLATGLTHYSEQGQAYVELIQMMIRNNRDLLELQSKL